MADPAAPPATPPVTPPAFDPETFVTRILGEFDKRTNALDKKLTAITKSIVREPLADPNNPLVDPANPPADPAAPPANPKIDPVVNAELQKLQRQIAALTKDNQTLTQERENEKKARLETERATAIRNVLNELPFRDQPSRDLFFRAVKDDIRWEDGHLVAESAGSTVTHDAYLKAQVEQYQHLLTPKGGGGAGASAGTGTRKGSSGPIKMSDLTPDKINALKPEEYAAMMKDILAGNIAG